MLYTYKAELEKVIDGDTIDVRIDLGFDIHHISRIRLIGIDAPEYRTKDLEEKKMGLAAKEYVEQWFERAGPYVIITTTKDKKGKYGRILGNVMDMNEEKSLNLELIEKGFAKTYE